jgi:plastocyanin
MSRIRLVLAAACVALVAAATALGSGTAAPKLTGTVGPGFTITLKKGSAKVTKLKAGKYTIVVKDLASNHNFHLSGPGVSKKTSTPSKGTSTWKVTLKKGTYRYVCDPHAAIMKGSFKVS